MAKSGVEKIMERQQREAKKRAEDEARRQKASAIISGQPLVGGLRIMDAASEEVFQALLQCYDGNESRRITGSYDSIPKAYHNSLQLEMEKLSMYGMISSPRVWIGCMWEVTLTPQGLSYFSDKEQAQEKAQQDIAKRNASQKERKEFDVFISHANKDKLDYVDALYMAIRKLGVRIFYDTEVISWGDKWKQVILDGTAKSEFAIIVISENFFDREWTEIELTEFLKRQNESGQKTVLPLLHNVSIDDMRNRYPFLEEIQVIDTEKYSKEEIAILFARELINRLR